MQRLGLWVLVAVDLAAFHIPGIWLFFFLLFPPRGTGGLPDALFNAFLVLCWGGIHSLMARKPVREFLGRRVGPPFVKLVFTVVAGLTQCAMLSLWRPLEGVLWQARGVSYGVLTLLFLSAFGAVFACSILLDYWEVLGLRGILRHFRGEPHPPSTLCLKGPYRYCRHPVYLATIASLWIGPVMTTGRLEFAALVTVYVWIGTWLEERDTLREFGEPYARYCANVPMWIPRMTPWRTDREA